MEPIDIKHMLFGFALVLVTILALIFDCPALTSGLVIAALCIYIILLLCVCAHRSRESNNKEKPLLLFDLPNRGWAIVLVILFVAINVIGFANIYLQTESVEFKENRVARTMEDKWDAVYFSAVTVTTLGYGDFTPTKTGRIYVLVHLASGLLLLLIAVPVAAARVSSWEGKGEADVQPCISDDLAALAWWLLASEAVRGDSTLETVGEEHGAEDA